MEQMKIVDWLCYDDREDEQRLIFMSKSEKED